MKRTLLAIAFLSAPALVGCGIPKEEYNARLAEIDKLKNELDDSTLSRGELKKKIKALETENESLKDRLRALGQDLSNLESEKGKLAANLEATSRERDELRRAREAAEARMAQYRQLFDKFKAMIDAGKLKVEIRNGLMLVKLADNILFDPGKTDLKPAGMEAIREVSAILAGIAGRKFQVAGHTDNLVPNRHGAFKTNWELSTARAVTVVKFMIAEGGMPADRVSAAGWADQMPVAPNDTAEGRQQNRRIEIVLLPNIEDLPPMEDVSKDAPAGAVTK